MLDLEIRYVLASGGLTVATAARNVGSTDAPYALGQHPYLTVGTTQVDDAVLTLPAPDVPAHRRRPDPDGPGAGRRDAVRLPRSPGDRPDRGRPPLHLARDAEGRAWLTLASHERERVVDVWVDEHFPYLEVFTADTVPDPARRRGWLGVEPMTSPPNAFRSGEDVFRLEPGELHECAWGSGRMHVVGRGSQVDLRMADDSAAHEHLARAGHYVVRFDNRDSGLSTHLDHLPVPSTLDILRKRRPPYRLPDMPTTSWACSTRCTVGGSTSSEHRWAARSPRWWHSSTGCACGA